MHPPPSTSWAENTIMTERTQEIGHRQSIFCLSSLWYCSPVNWEGDDQLVESVSVLRIWIRVRRIRMFLGLPDPDPCSQRYGSGSFYHQSKIVWKTLIPTPLRLLFDFLALIENWCKCTFQAEKLSFLLASWRSMTKIAGSGSASGSISQMHGSADPDPDPHQRIRNTGLCL